MAEYFEKEALIREIISDMALFMGDPDAVQEHDERCNYAISCIGNAPPADVALVRHGRWISWEEAGNYVPSPDRHECSVCHDAAQVLVNGLELLSDYCPNCGAKMDLEGDHEAG